MELALGVSFELPGFYSSCYDDLRDWTIFFCFLPCIPLIMLHIIPWGEQR